MAPLNRSGEGEISTQILRFEGSGSVLRDYKNRQHYKRTRSGCVMCKSKRVKCDEGKPVCVRCQRNGRVCRYKEQDKATDSDEEGSDTTKNQKAITLTTSLMSARIDQLIPFLFAGPDLHSGTPSQHLMIHFYRNALNVFNIFRVDDIASLAESSPLVRSSVMALSASHLRHASGGTVLEYKVAECFHKSVAIKHLRELLQAPRDTLNASDVNFALVSGMLLNMMAFTLSDFERSGDSNSEEVDVNTSWVYSDRTDRLDWLCLQAGLRPLLLSVPAYVTSAMKFLAPIFMGDDEGAQWRSSHVYLENCLEMVPKTWRKMFELIEVDGTSVKNSRSDIYRSPVVLLAELKGMKSRGVEFTVFRAIPFLSKVVGPFRQLLLEKDERAMWLFGYWLGIFCRFKSVWWCNERAKKDYLAARQWLRDRRLVERTGKEGEIWKELMEELDAVPLS